MTVWELCLNKKRYMPLLTKICFCFIITTILNDECVVYEEYDK